MEEASYREGQYVLIKEGRNQGARGKIIALWYADETWWYRLAVDCEMFGSGRYWQSAHYFAYTQDEVEQI